MVQKNKCKLVLENAQEFTGVTCAADKAAVGEIVFNTSMVGYQEIISDAAYAGQIVVMTYPPMGQYGITDEDSESRTPAVAGLVVRECCETPSNFRYTKTLSEELEEHGIPCISELDTRMITRIIRDNGTMMAAIVSESVSKEEALKMIADKKALINAGEINYVKEVSCTKRWFKRTENHKHDVVIVDCGLKLSIIDCLNKRGCNVTVVPSDTSAEEILGFNPDGIMISSGPGDPRTQKNIVDTICELKGKLPICGVALGHELICMAYGAKIEKLKAGHHGGAPVRDLESGKITIVEHNHNFAVDRASAQAAGLSVVYEDICDKTVEGIKCESDKVLSSQFYPEGGPGPEEASFFDRFVSWMEEK